jgi:hypothetical protein
MSQGKNANINGSSLEKQVEAFFIENNIDYVKQHRYESIFGHNAKMDFYIESLDLAVECKNQEGNGSVVEKLPYVMESFEQHPCKNGLLILGGKFWPNKPGVVSWAIRRGLRSNKDIKVIFFSELGEWFEQTSSRS